MTLSDNRTSTGRLEGRVLTVSLVARRGIWHPEGPQAPGVEIAAFGVESGALTNPGPLLRVPAGTEIRASVRNSLLSPMTVHGLGSSVLAVPPGEARSVRFVAGTPGTFFYWATTTGAALDQRSAGDAQLNGAFVIDRPGAVPTDRVFLISHHSENQYEVWAINGASWPDTERLSYRVGDPVRWRWINASNHYHPMHLHGAYFRVEGADRLVNTHVLDPGAAIEMSWSPDRAGNWLFHCHVLYHIAPELHLVPVQAGHETHDPSDIWPGWCSASP